MGVVWSTRVRTWTRSARLMRGSAEPSCSSRRAQLVVVCSRAAFFNAPRTAAAADSSRCGASSRCAACSAGCFLGWRSRRVHDRASCCSAVDSPIARGPYRRGQLLCHLPLLVRGEVEPVALVQALRDPCPCSEAEMLHALDQFAFYALAARTQAAPGDDSAASRELTSDARQLIDEASAYAYFSLTLLDIFSSEGLERRTQLAAAHGPEGDPERLADARQELGISPYSARPLIDTIRKAWSLPLAPTTSSYTPSLPAGCPRHHRHA